jgi:peptidyl-dipeptidase A
VRWKLREKYGDLVPASVPIPAHLLGNMWAQEWENIIPLIAPKDADPGYDLTAILKGRGTQPADMVKYGERFFTSLGFAHCQRRFGSGHYSSSRAIAMWCVTRAPGT